jgi:amidohydrolase
MAMLLGAALVLRRMRERLRGSVRFVFQPGEEVVAYGRELVASGALRNPAPKAVLALHAWDRLPVGTIAAKPGLSMAAADVFRIGVHGKGGHGSRPEACVNPVLVAAGIVRDLQRIPVFRAGRREPLVMSICRLAGGTNANVVPGTAEIEGSVRYLRVARSPALRRMVEKVIRSACLAAGATYELAYRSAYIPTVNTAWLVRLGRRVARRELGPQRWQDLVSPTMGSEDFAFYLKRHPGAIYRLGMGQDSPPLHSAAFDFNDGALQHGILFLVAMTLAIQSGGQARWRGRDSWQASTSMAR